MTMKDEINTLLSKPASYYTGALKITNNEFVFNKPVVLFGAANMGILFKKFCTTNDINVLAFCDNDKNKVGTTILNTKVISPSMLKQYCDSSVQIIITSSQDDEIKHQLTNYGFTNNCSHSYLSTIYPAKFPTLCWSTNINYIINNSESIKKCFNLLKDSVSKKHFINILRYRLTLNNNYLASIAYDHNKAYFDKNIIKLSKDEVFLDGGAFDGDTLKEFISITNNNFNKVYCFEPDPKSYSKLKSFLVKLNDSRIIPLKLGLGNKEESLYFASEGNIQSKIVDSSKMKIKIVPIDNYIDQNFTFIKLDIEGHEKEALKGASKTIKSKKPKLAICVYHHYQDLWEIPLLIKEQNPDYDIYLRHYGHTLFDTICYAKC